jgi:general secretion pathway protein C
MKNNISNLIIRFYKIYFIFLFVFLGVPTMFAGAHFSVRASSIILPESQLPFRVVGVIISEISTSSVAVLKNINNGEIAMVRIGESLLGMRLTRISKYHVFFERENKTYQLYIGGRELLQFAENPEKVKKEIQAPQKIKPSQPKQLESIEPKELERTELEKRIKEEMPILMSSARIIPNMVAGKMEGFKISKLPQTSILSELGIHKNDIIKEINGTKINDLESLLSLYQRIWSENLFHIVLERNGKIVRMQFVLK